MLGLVTLALMASPEIVDRPIRFDETRKALTLAYRRAHVDPSARSIDITPKVIVVHHTGMKNLETAWRYFDEIEIERGRRKIARAGRVNVSAHFLVDRDGTIVRLMPETRMARHTIGLNHVSIGIENVGGTKDTPLTRAQLRANAALIRALATRHPITHLIGHHEYRAMEGHAYFRERNPKYRTTKIDPGAAFMAGLRRKLKDLELRGP